jgi:hypothetical protein
MATNTAAWPLAPAALPTERAAAIPWTIWACVAAVTSVTVGGHWDIAWHRAIGRDEFFTPPHLAIYFCGVLAGAACAWLILRTSFGRDNTNATVGIWGLRAPLGAFLIAWGGAMMLTSAPFDDWWHNAYGLDTKILSPPHMLLVAGILAVEAGTLLLIMGAMNRLQNRALNWLLLYTGGMMLVTLLVSVMELSSRLVQHTAMFYRAMAIVAPATLIALGSASRIRWGATWTAGVYTLLHLLMIWILPLVPAEPKLGPVYVPVTHLVPPFFPVLLLAPAAAIDWYRQRGGANAFALGAIFLGVLLAVQWPFANFLMGEHARNWFFGSHYLGYYSHPNSLQRLNQFATFEKTSAAFALTLAQALLAASAMSWLGLRWGRWMRSIVR